MSSQECADAGIAPPSTTAPCNRFPCPSDVVVWRVGEWGPCVQANTSAVLQCGVGIQRRDVSCVTASGGGTVSSGACASLAHSVAVPSSQQPCNVGACGCSSSSDCSGLGDHLVCSNSSGRCTCEDGWGGAQCDVVALQSVGSNCSSTAIVDVNGTCCESGSAIDSVTGLCCDVGAVTDGSGRCCDGGVGVDACGVCGGDGVVVDVSGVCCSWPLSPSGVCCEGVLDSCGVCGGTNDCDAVVTVSLPSSANASSVAGALGLSASSIVNYTVVSHASATVSRLRAAR